MSSILQEVVLPFQEVHSTQSKHGHFIEFILVIFRIFSNHFKLFLSFVSLILSYIHLIARPLLEEAALRDNWVSICQIFNYTIEHI